MAVPKLVQGAKGVWNGTSRLHLSYLPPDQRVAESPSALRVDANDAYATIAYTWAHEGVLQQGTMLVAMDDETKAVEIGWVDSFHMNASVMHLHGAESAGGAVETKGSFAAGEETWGWTIALDLVGDEFTLTMNVIPPGEEPDWAVRAAYRRE